jgi:hypothetical protein
MNTLRQFLSQWMSANARPVEARGLLERAANARGLSQDEAAQLRSNALAMLSVVR